MPIEWLAEFLYGVHGCSTSTEWIKYNIAKVAAGSDGVLSKASCKTRSGGHFVEKVAREHSYPSYGCFRRY